MGVFSWITQDTNKSIAIAGNPGGRKHMSVTMTDNQGNHWREHAYEGYGEFGGMDYYVLVARMNPSLHSEVEKEMRNKSNHFIENPISLRDIGIEIAFGNYADEAKFPNLTEATQWQWIDNKPEDCEYQGYFYDY